MNEDIFARPHNWGGCKKYRRLVEAALQLPPVRAAVIHPSEPGSLAAAVEIAAMGLIEPVLIGPAAHIRGMAIRNGIDISGLPLIEAEHSTDAAARAVELVQRGDVDALIQGDLHVCELMGAVAAHAGGILRGGRISHCFIADLPGCAGPQIIMDASAYGAPTPDAKARVIENAIELAQAMHISEVQMTILSTMETITSSVPSAGTLTAPGDLFQPAGCATVLVLPDLTAAEILVKSLSLLAGAEGAGMVLGARVPIILRSRTDSRWPRIASCAIVSLLGEARRSKAATNAAERTSVDVGQSLIRDRRGAVSAGAIRGLARAA